MRSTAVCRALRTRGGVVVRVRSPFGGDDVDVVDIVMLVVALVVLLGLVAWGVGLI